MAKKSTTLNKPTEVFNIIYIVTWFIMPFVLFIFRDGSQDAGLFPRVSLLALSTIISGVLLATKKTKAFPFLITIAAIAFFVMWHFSGFLNAYSSTEVWATTARNGIFLAYLLVTFQLLRNGLLSFKSLVKAGIAFGAIASLSLTGDILKLIGKGQLIEQIYQVTGLFLHKNFAASALLMTIPFLYLGTRLENKPWRYVAMGILALSIAEIIVLRTRGVWLGFIGGVGSTVILQLLSTQKENRQLRFIGISSFAFIAVLAVALATSGASEKVFNRANIDVRFIYWNSSVEMAQEHPLTGVGAGNWKINFPKHGLTGTNLSVMTGETNIVRPHNDMLWVLAELGIPGWIALAAFQLLLLFICVKLLNHTDGEKRNYAMATIFGLVAFAVYGLGEFPLERPVTVGLLILLAAEGLRLGEQEAITKKALFTLKPMVLNALIISIAAFGFWVSNKRIAGEKEAKKAIDAYEKRNPSKMLRYGESAQNAFFEIDIYNSPMKFFTGIGQLGNGKLQDAQREFQDALAINPFHLNTIKQLGDCYKYQNKFDLAIEQYEKAKQISPRFYMADLSLTEIYLRQKKYEKAVAALNKVHYNTEYAKYKQLGLQVLVSFGQQPTPKQHKAIYALVKNNKSDTEALWEAYNALKQKR